MPRDSNGNASTDPVYVATPGTQIRSVQHNTPIADIISMLTGSLARNGTGGMLANLSMGGYQIKGLADGVLATDAMAFGQLGAALATGVGTVNMSGSVSRSGILSPAQITADQNNYAPTQASAPTTLDAAATLRLTSDAARTITGLVAPTTNPDGREIRFVNVGSFALTLAAESASSTAANRFAISDALVIPPFGAVDLVYDATSSRWRALASVQVTNDNLPGSPTTTTQAGSDNSTKIATTAHVKSALAARTVITATVSAAGGSAVEITGIPAGARKITLMCQGISVSSDAEVNVQLGTASAYSTSGYIGSGTSVGPSGSAYSGVKTTGITANAPFYASSTSNLFVEMSRVASTNTWIARSQLGQSAGTYSWGSACGSIALAGALTRVRISVASGTFDAGTVSAIVEVD